MSELRTAAGQPCLMAFDRTNPAAVDWARTRAATLVTEVTTQTQQAIRDIVARAFTDGIPPREAAKLIKGAVGLRTDQVKSLLDLRQQLLDAQVKAARTGKVVKVLVPGSPSPLSVTGAGLSRDRMQSLLLRYADRQLRQRALLIARTETIAAANAGQQELWRQVVEKKLLRGNEYQKWTTTNDERRCPVCRAMNGVKVPLGQPFVTQLGTVTGPPAHPNCRCSVVLAPAPLRPR